MKFLLKIVITAVNALILAYIIPGIHLDSIFTALILALVLAVLDAVVKPLLILFTLPATIFTLGLFLFVINACIILIGDYLVDGFRVDSFWYALLFSILLSFFNSFVHKRALAEDKKNNN